MKHLYLTLIALSCLGLALWASTSSAKLQEKKEASQAEEPGDKSKDAKKANDASEATDTKKAPVATTQLWRYREVREWHEKKPDPRERLEIIPSGHSYWKLRTKIEGLQADWKLHAKDDVQFESAKSDVDKNLKLDPPKLDDIENMVSFRHLTSLVMDPFECDEIDLDEPTLFYTILPTKIPSRTATSVNIKGSMKLVFAKGAREERVKDIHESKPVLFINDEKFKANWSCEIVERGFKMELKVYVLGDRNRLLDVKLVHSELDGLHYDLKELTPGVFTYRLFDSMREEYELSLTYADEVERVPHTFEIKDFKLP